MRNQRIRIVIFCLWLTSAKSESQSTYGNEVKERATSGMDGDVQPGPRIWIDNPLNGESWPRWGYLSSFRVYIHQLFTPELLPSLHLQIWTNTSIINNYTLKWQKTLSGYTSGRLYELPVDVGEVVEVNEYDRIGFTNEGNYTTIALDLEVDDPISASTAHRTYFRYLYRDKYSLPVVGDSRYVDNNALRGRFSIAIVVNRAPPRSPTEVYFGHDLRNRPLHQPSFSNRYLLDDSTVLSAGRVTSFYFRLEQMTSVTPLHLQIWQKTSDTNYILVYNKSINLNTNPAAMTYNVSVSDGPLVDNRHRFGWMTPAAPIFYSDNSNVTIYTMTTSDSGSSPSFTLGQSYVFDGLAWNYEFSIGVIVDQMTSNPIEPSKTTSTTTTTSSTATTSTTTTTSSTPTTSTTSQRTSSTTTLSTPSSPLTTTKPTTRGPPSPFNLLSTSGPSSVPGSSISTATSSMERTKTTTDRDDINEVNLLRSSASVQQRLMTSGLRGLIWIHIIAIVTLHFLHLIV